MSEMPIFLYQNLYIKNLHGKLLVNGVSKYSYTFDSWLSLIRAHAQSSSYDNICRPFLSLFYSFQVSEFGRCDTILKCSPVLIDTDLRPFLFIVFPISINSR